jgi:hypothetical protein
MHGCLLLNDDAVHCLLLIARSLLYTAEAGWLFQVLAGFSGALADFSIYPSGTCWSYLHLGTSCND